MARPVSLVLGGVFSLLIGALAVLLALRGLLGKGGAADVATAWPNLLTGIASLVGGVGYLLRKKWALAVYTLAVIGHFVSHGMLHAAHAAAHPLTPPGMISLWLTPLLALLVLVTMARHAKQGILT